jgi:predicted O-linked N-acetylglucosamine transferase (SPINDLY family)
LETPESDAHYSERLIRLANLGTYYYRPRLGEQKPRAALGLDPDRHLYVCCQTLFKMHPDFDPILAEILRRDPLADIVLIEGRRPVWTKQLKARFQRAMPDVAGRVRFLQPLPNADFLQLNAQADVLLDTLHFGGGNTSYEGLALGTPIVTLPSEFLRGGLTRALYHKMQLPDCIVSSAEEYAKLAVQLGTDQEYRRHVSQRIQERAEVLYEDPAEVHELERFLAWAAEGGSGSWTIG